MTAWLDVSLIKTRARAGAQIRVEPHKAENPGSSQAGVESSQARVEPGSSRARGSSQLESSRVGLDPGSSWLGPESARVESSQARVRLEPRAFSHSSRIRLELSRAWLELPRVFSALVGALLDLLELTDKNQKPIPLIASSL